jgi:hypothetical protein
MNRTPEAPQEPREEADPTAEPAPAQNTAGVPPGALWAPAGADAAEMARRQRVVAAMGKAKPRAKWGAR